jgi:membrane AbrB-like protein
VYLAKYIRVPTPYLIAPVIGTAALVLSGIEAPALPYVVIALAQVCVGIRMGMAVEVSSLANVRKLLTINFISVIVVILALLGIDYVLSRISSISLVTAFISTAPGGITEMGLTALMVHADLSTVIAFQLFRLMFVLLIAIPVIRWWLCHRNKTCITYCPLE